MIEIIFKSKGKKLRGKVPSSWAEITVKQFMALELLEEPLEILSEIMEIDLTYIQNSTANLTPAMNRVIEIFNARPPDLENRKPEGFGFQGRLIKFPRDMDKFMFGQTIQINQLLEEDPNKHLVKIMGIAIQPLIDGEFIEANQDKYSRLLERLPIIEVFPELFFFAETLKKHKRFGLRDLMRSL